MIVGAGLDELPFRSIPLPLARLPRRSTSLAAHSWTFEPQSFTIRAYSIRRRMLNTPFRTKITALGTYVPPRELTNSDLEKMVQTSNEWILERMGINTRQIAAR